jgi:hypothetical protein
MNSESEKSKPTVEEIILGEREFLHSISSPLMVAMSHLELLQQKAEQLQPDQIMERIAKAKTSLDKVGKFIFERRVYIKNLQETEN